MANSVRLLGAQFMPDCCVFVPTLLVCKFVFVCESVTDSFSPAARRLLPECRGGFAFTCVPRRHGTLFHNECIADSGQAQALGPAQTTSAASNLARVFSWTADGKVVLPLCHVADRKERLRTSCGDSTSALVRLAWCQTQTALELAPRQDGRGSSSQCLRHEQGLERLPRFRQALRVPLVLSASEPFGMG